MKRRMAVLFAFLVVTTTAFAQEKPIYGFTPTDAAKEQALEAKFDGYMNAADLRAWMDRLAARPHHIGSEYQHQNTEFLVSLFRSWGYDATVAEYQVLFPTPKTRVLEMVGPQHYTAKLAEPPLSQDSTSGQTSEQLPTYNAYSIDGDVTGDLVYVNYGVPADYDQLERNGVDVKGKIVIARYGGSWRGIKPKVAAEHGAIGCIIYSDPRDDGYYQGDVYPGGAYRMEWGVQRGSVEEMELYPGDPLTPGIAATPNAKRLSLKDCPVLTKIPVLPISYGDALPLLRALGGPVAPPDWRGALPVTYHLGPGPARVHLKLAFDWKLVPARDVIARLPGTDRADEWIIRGNHYDAWVNGADDPISGQVAMLEEAHAVGELAKSGSRPRRTIIYCAWDGEEPGLLGSTEWVEDHMADLQQHAVTYINSDSNSRGFLEAGGSHSLERLMTQVARDVKDPERNISVLERRRLRQQTFATSPEQRKEARERELIQLSALGSGSDYSSFLQHAGVAAMNIGYGGEGGGGSYHSIYDSIDWYTRFGDPGFKYGIAQAETTGRLVLRLANADILPIDFSTFADTVSRYVDELEKLAQSERSEIADRDRLIRVHAYEISSDPTKTYVPPKADAPAPFLNFAPLQNAVSRLQQSAREYERAAASLPSDDPNASVREAELDQLLMHAEQTLTTSQGLPRRPWYKHQIYAPGFYTGYGVKTVPGVREAIEQKDWAEANKEIEVVAGVIDAYTANVDRATAIARGKSE